jgi:hypothetical protein
MEIREIPRVKARGDIPVDDTADCVECRVAGTAVDFVAVLAAH